MVDLQITVDLLFRVEIPAKKLLTKLGEMFGNFIAKLENGTKAFF
jgi:hypothetical protein